MSALTDTLPSARYSMGYVIVRFPNGEEIRFPVAENARLAGKPDAALNRIEVSPFGLHWPELDEDLSFSGLRVGNYGQCIPTRTTNS
jgi:Protein of unknown function (DUF2442)